MTNWSLLTAHGFSSSVDCGTIKKGNGGNEETGFEILFKNLIKLKVVVTRIYLIT